MRAIICAFAFLFPSLCLPEPYAGVSVGVGYIDDQYEDEGIFYDVDDKSPSFRAFFGYEWKAEGVGVATEFSYLYSDDMDTIVAFAIDDLILEPDEADDIIYGLAFLDREVDIKALGADILFSYETGRVSPFVSIGYYYWDVNLDLDNELKDTDVGLSYEGNNLSYGAGVDLRISRHLGARLEWKRLDMEIGEWDVAYDTFLLGAKVVF